MNPIVLCQYLDRYHQEVSHLDAQAARLHGKPRRRYLDARTTIEKKIERVLRSCGRVDEVETKLQTAHHELEALVTTELRRQRR